MLVDLLSADVPPSHDDSNGGNDAHERLDAMTGGPIPALFMSNDDKS